MQIVQHTDTHTGTYTYMGEARVSCDICMGWPIRVWASPYVYAWKAYTRMGRIPVWDGTYTHAYGLYT